MEASMQRQSPVSDHYSGEETLWDETTGEYIDFAMDEDFRNQTGRKTQVDKYQFEVLSTEEIMQHMLDIITEVNTVLQIPATTTRILLNHFKWDKEMLLERFYDGDQDQLFADARIINPFRKPKVKRAEKVPSSKTEECEICLMDQASSVMTGLECGHRFCTDCWGEYLTSKIMKEGVGQNIACAAKGCKILVDDATVMRLLDNSDVKRKYQHLITNCFVECNRLLRWCPAPGCNNAIKVQYAEARPVTCKCSHTFCFACGENWHEPVNCHILSKWMKMCDSDAMTLDWIAVNTKECPECKVMIEKTEGCNHIICKNQRCKADFCWVCLGPWQQHVTSFFNCNRYDEEAAKATQNIQYTSQRNIFYYNRYLNHMQSLKFEKKLYSLVKQKVVETLVQSKTWIEIQFLKAVDVLCQCRQTLMYTYVFAFYLRKNNQSVIFEDNQKDLENATETLSEYLGRDLRSENLTDISQRVQDKYRYCDHRRKVLLEHVHEGYEKQWWEHTE